MLKKALIFITFFLVFLFPGKVFADSDFSTSYDVTYDILNNGVANVTQKVTLKNLTSQYYVSNFTLTIGSTTLTDVLASDESGPMETKVDTSGNKTSINVKFNKQLAGVDKSQALNLKYKSRDFAQSVGKTWEVNLPRIPTTNNISGYNLVLSVPINFGDPTSISPQPKSRSQTGDKLFLYFNKDQLSKSGVSVNFGTTQVFDFIMKYHLENNALFPIVTSLSLPPDTQYQDILISRINPEPANVTIDEDGNYLAWYKLNRKESKDVVINGSVKLYINPKNKLIPVLTGDQRKNYTKTDQYWEKDNPAINATLSEIFKSSPKSAREKINLIYKYVVNTLKYDTNRLNDVNLERLGAVTVLNNPDSAICMEFTDLFIALSRAAGIPARELDGYAYSQNQNLRPLSLGKDLLHAWPEYYDEDRGWVMVDPTWENTSGGVDYFNKFDLNHFVLATRGLSSKQPFTSEDVKVTISSSDFLGKSQTDLTFDGPESIWAGLPSKLRLKVYNRGNAATGEMNLSINSSQIDILGQKNLSLDSIPPFGSTDLEFNLRTPSVWQSLSDKIEVNVEGQKFTKDILVKPFIFIKPFPYIFFGIIGLVVSIYLFTLALHIRNKRISQSTK